MTVLSINTDVGEGFGVWGIVDESALLAEVTAANVACGFHAGDPDILRRTCDTAAELGVSIGAQVSYRDLAGFGRRFIEVPPPTLVNDLVYQIGALQAFARISGTEVTYVKAHGALYNAAARHEGHAWAIVEAVGLVDPALPVLCQYRTQVWELALSAGLQPHAEVFVDRGYTDEGLLVGRSHPDALLTDPGVAAARAWEIVRTASVVSVGGVRTTVLPEQAPAVALCVHSDTPGAVEIARETRKVLERNGSSPAPIGPAR
ncbi:LamB/YcsF family protein [Nocardia carnea]|uniref:LamB/YcsF family protein n=1 Tax=Nocardia carnea TaxID=37328 RepID=UPI002458595B|nr:5-oxoprolinase subunit PxpA [Nocardia carnea]